LRANWETRDCGYYEIREEPLVFTMSEIRAMTMILRRMFSRKASDPLAGVRKKMKLLDQDESVDSFDAEDVSEFESDFMNVGMSHKMYVRYVYKFIIYTKILYIAFNVGYNFMYK